MKKYIVFLISIFFIIMIGCGSSKETLKESQDTRQTGPEVEAAQPEKIENAEEKEQDVNQRDVEKDKIYIPDGKKIDLSTIYFDFDRFDIRPDARRILIENARILDSNPGISVIVEGHCDERGTIDYNLVLGEKRAESAKNFLVIYGIRADRTTIVSFGEEKPAVSEHNERAWALNRRCNFVIKEK
ncbi:OmpA family protein [candidate division KSB1 bacterium]